MNQNHIAIHVLTAYPPSNPNRDENGSPKSAIVGGVTRQRISSQCVKRTWRLSDIMQDLEAQYSTRTRGVGVEAQKAMLGAGMTEKLALTNATAIAGVFGKVDKKKEPQNSEVVVLGAEEVKAVEELVTILIAESRKPTEQELGALPRTTNSLDVAMFGRMRAAAPNLNTDASIYVSHPLTTNKASIDADFWTAVDDLKELDEKADGGAGGMGETEFGSGSFYTYVQVNLTGLSQNLGGETELAKKAVVALIRAIATTSPTGHKATFGNEVRASFLRVEVGQPSGNLFCKAFEKPVATTPEAINILREVIAKETSVYGLNHVAFELSTVDGEGSLNSVIESVSKALESK